jgi:hypothetical protein
MGNNQPCTHFNPTGYVKAGITEKEVLGLRNVFESLEPKVQSNFYSFVRME